MTEDIIKAIENNPNFEICININLKIKEDYLNKMKYEYPYSIFGIDLLGREYGKIYSGNERNELTYSIEEFEEYIDIYECDDIHPTILSVDICSLFQNGDKFNMYNVSEEVLKCKLTLQDISYSDKIIYLEAEIIE